MERGSHNHAGRPEMTALDRMAGKVRVVMPAPAERVGPCRAWCGSGRLVGRITMSNPRRIAPCTRGRRRAFGNWLYWLWAVPGRTVTAQPARGGLTPQPAD